MSLVRLLAPIVFLAGFAASAEASTQDGPCRDPVDVTNPAVVPRDLIVVEKDGVIQVTGCFVSGKPKLAYIAIYVTFFGSDQRMLTGAGTTLAEQSTTIGRSAEQPLIIAPATVSLPAAPNMPLDNQALVVTAWQECEQGNETAGCVPIGLAQTASFLIKVKVQTGLLPKKACNCIP